MIISMKSVLSKITLSTFFWLGLCVLTACHQVARTEHLNLDHVADEIIRLNNELRRSKNLEPLSSLDSLKHLAKRHSLNMANKDFFDHRDPEGLNPHDRMQTFAPALLSKNSGENIALRSHGGESETRFAEILMKMWQDSPEHYANLISPEFRHIGVALASAEDKIYATQSFANGIALLENDLPLTAREGDSLRLDFVYLADFAPDELSCFFMAADPSARIPVGDGSSYIGKGPIQAQWSDEGHFSLNIEANYGRGEYKVLLGQNQSYFQQAIRIQVDSKE